MIMCIGKDGVNHTRHHYIAPRGEVDNNTVVIACNVQVIDNAILEEKEAQVKHNIKKFSPEASHPQMFLFIQPPSLPALIRVCYYAPFVPQPAHEVVIILNCFQPIKARWVEDERSQYPRQCQEPAGYCNKDISYWRVKWTVCFIHYE